MASSASLFEYSDDESNSVPASQEADVSDVLDEEDEPTLSEALQTAIDKIETLEETNQALEEKNESLAARLESLEEQHQEDLTSELDAQYDRLAKSHREELEAELEEQAEQHAAELEELRATLESKHEEDLAEHDKKSSQEITKLEQRLAKKRKPDNLENIPPTAVKKHQGSTRYALNGLGHNVAPAPAEELIHYPAVTPVRSKTQWQRYLDSSSCQPNQRMVSPTLSPPETSVSPIPIIASPRS